MQPRVFLTEQLCTQCVCIVCVHACAHVCVSGVCGCGCRYVWV